MSPLEMRLLPFKVRWQFRPFRAVYIVLIAWLTVVQYGWAALLIMFAVSFDITVRPK